MDKSKVVLYDTSKEEIKIIIEDIFKQFPMELEGKKVLVKPNMLGPFEQEKGVTTNPIVIEALVTYLLERKADVIVGDNPGGQGGGVVATAKKCGIYQASLGRFQSISKSCRMIDLKSRFLKEINVSDAIMDADIIINLPRFKTHGYAGLSGAIKNMFGIVVGPGKAKLHFKTPKPEDFHELLVDLYQVRVPDLVIMDGIYAMEGMGPTTGDLRPLNKILASIDGVALDATVARMMGFDLELIRHITIAAERGIGHYMEDEIVIIGDNKPIENFKLPISYDASVKITAPKMSGVMELYKLGSTVPNFDKPDLCLKCGECAKSCPVLAITMEPYPVINRRKCISCFCCAELCLKGCFGYVDGVKVFDKLFSALGDGTDEN
ncbi:MAG: DUF362 domain-containing protein [Lutisporaceae bacterium]